MLDEEESKHALETNKNENEKKRTGRRSKEEKEPITKGYHGELNGNNQPEGEGTYNYPKDDIYGRRKYSGHWENGLWHGMGTLIWISGTSYEGQFQAGEP